jgi:hypothetical protein
MGHDTRWLQTLVPDKPVIAVLQAWQIHWPVDGKEGLPTPEQSRYMAYQVVIAGSRGILYYGRIRASTPAPPAGLPETIDPNPQKAAEAFKKAKTLNDEFWSNFRPVLKELSDMSPVFAAPDADWQPHVKVLDRPEDKLGPIEFRVKQAGPGAAILLVNSSEKPAKVQVTAPKLANAAVHVWHGKGDLKADASGAFTDELKPFDVRVYSDQPEPHNQ